MARKNRQRTSLEQLTGASHADATNSMVMSTAASTSARSASTSTFNTTKMSSAFSNIPTVTSSSHTPIASISSIPSNSSVASASTVTPSASSVAKEEVNLKGKGKDNLKDKDRLAKSKGSSGFFGNRNIGTTIPNKYVDLSSKRQEGMIDNSKNDSIGSTGPLLLPLLPELEDFELSLSMPFLSDFTATTTTTPTSTSSAPPSFSSFATPPSSYSSPSSRPLSSAGPTLSSFAPTSSQFLTSKSPRVQEYIGPSPSSTLSPRVPPLSGTANIHSANSSNPGTVNFQRKPSMHSRTTTIDASGTIHQQSPLDLSRLEVSNYFMHNDDDLSTQKSSTKNSEHGRTGDTSDRERGRAQPQIGAPTNDDLLSPRRYIIRQPSLTGLSGTSRTTSPVPSLTSSVITDRSSLRSSHHAQSLHQQQQQQHRQLHGHTVDTPTQQRQISSASQSETASDPLSKDMTLQTEKTPVTGLGRTPPGKRADLSATTSAQLPKHVNALKQSPGTGQDMHSPNLRSRLSRLFRSSPKPERLPSHDQRQRDQQRTSKQTTVLNTAPRQPAQSQTQLRSAGQTSSQIQTQEQPQAQQRPPQRLSSLQPQQQLSSGATSAPATVSSASRAPIPTAVSLPTTAAASQEQSPFSSKTGSPPALRVDQRQEYSSMQGVAGNPAEENQEITTDQITDNNLVPRPRSRNVSALPSPQTPGSQTPFTPGVVSVSRSPPGSPSTREENKARQRRVSSVSSSHSIRQVGTYGGGVNPNKMISPARKANPYYSGVVARFANGGKHSLHDRELSNSSGKRRSLVSVGGERARVGTEAATSREKLNGVELAKSSHVDARRQSVASTISSAVFDSKDKDSLQRLPGNPGTRDTPVRMSDAARLSNNAAAPPPMPTMFTAAYSEEYRIERDESARNSVRSSPFGTVNAKTLHTRPLSPTSPASLSMSLTSTAPAGANAEQSGSDRNMSERHHLRNGLPSTVTTWSTATGAPTEFGTIPETISSATRTDQDYSRTLPSFESQDSDADATPSVSTLSSAQIVQDYRSQGIITTHDDWNDSESQHDNAPPIVTVQRPSMDVSILPVQPPFAQSTRPMSTASSIMSSSSNKHPQQPQAQRFASMGQWSESSYDPCAPLRWDELFEMDPNSKGPLWLSNRSLGQIPHEFFDGLRNLRELYLDHNDIKIVPDSLLKLTKLDVLDLSCNSISSFHSAFKLKKLKNLRRLNLDHNMLTDISPIYKLKALRELRMNHNFVPYLAIAIHNMTKLKILAMESNSLATLPETMGKLGNLCELRLSDNNLRVLPESIGSIRTLQVLALRSNLLEKLPESWKDMENLSTLDLACNRLTSLPGDIVRLPKLTHLDLHDNQIEALPEKIGQLSNLVVLHLCNNQLRELPKDIGRLRDLHDLVLSFNQLQYLPDEIGKLSKLQDLKFDNNPLRSLPRTIQRLTNVRRVHLQGCQLRDLPVELGVAFRDLIYLDLSGNQFEVMPALDQMTKLEEFYISNNQLREIGTSSLNLQSSSNSNNSYTTGATSGTMGGGTGFISHAHAGSGSMSQGGQVGANAAQVTGSGGTLSSTQGSGSTGFSSSMVSGGVTASKLSELKRLRVLEAHGNQIRVLSSKIKMLPRLEVLDLGDNFLTWLPKEVGDLAVLKVLILEGNPIKSLPSTLSRLMGTLEVFRIGEWPKSGFEITRDQSPMNMKINVLQSFMPQQIERTLLLRMHESILRRMQELDSQQYRERHETERNSDNAQTSGAPTLGSSRLSGSAYALSSTSLQQTRSSSPNPDSGVVRSHRGVAHGLTIATQNMMAFRSFALPPASPGNDSSSSDPTKTPLLMLNSEGINTNYVEYTPSSLRTLPPLQLSGFRGHSAPITTLPLTTSPQKTSIPTGPMSSFPLLNSLRPRKSQQQLAAKSGGALGSRPKTMYAATSPHDLQSQEQAMLSPSLGNRMSRVFEFAGSNRQKNDGSASRIATLESSTLQLSTDAMVALGLGTQPGSVGSVIAHSDGSDRLGLGDGSLMSIRSSMAIKSSPSLTSIPLQMLSPRPTSPAPIGSGSGNQSSAHPSRTLSGRPISPIPGHASHKQLRRSASTVGNLNGAYSPDRPTTSVPWLRLKSSMMPFSPSQEDAYQQQQGDYPGASASITSTVTTVSTASLLLQPSVNGEPISGPTPPPIFLDYNLDTSSSLDIPSHLYYSAGGDDVDGDHPDVDENTDRGIDGETEHNDQSTTTGGDGLYSQRNKGKGRVMDAGSSARLSQELSYLQHQQLYHHQYQQRHHYFHDQLNATDPVLKIAVLKGIYDQILQNTDPLLEQSVQESPAKKNNRFKLLNTLRFLKADRNGSSGGGNGSNGSYPHPHQQYQHQQHQGQQYHHHQHHSSMSGSLSGHHPLKI